MAAPRGSDLRRRGAPRVAAAPRPRRASAPVDVHRRRAPCRSSRQDRRQPGAALARRSRCLVAPIPRVRLV